MRCRNRGAVRFTAPASTGMGRIPVEVLEPTAADGGQVRRWFSHPPHDRQRDRIASRFAERSGTESAHRGNPSLGTINGADEVELLGAELSSDGRTAHERTGEEWKPGRDIDADAGRR